MENVDIDEDDGKAAKNEKIFKDYFKTKFGEDSLNGKKSYKDKLKNVSISVDEHFSAANKLFLIEIDSGNMAKLLVGQYVLINELSQKNLDEAVFVVIHFYKDYNPDRTKRNLDLVSSNLYQGASIPHLSLTYEGFQEICKEVQDIEALASVIINRLQVKAS